MDACNWFLRTRPRGRDREVPGNRCGPPGALRADDTAWHPVTARNGRQRGAGALSPFAGFLPLQWSSLRGRAGVGVDFAP
jgi:hypothetical protein